MAVVSPPSFLQFGSHSASSDRLTIAALLQPGATPLATRGGVRPSGDGNSLRVSAQNTPTNSVQVAAGSVFIPESDGQGVYVVHNDAPVSLTVNSASTTQNRRDLVIMEVLDQEVSGSSNLAQLRVVTGTAVSGTATAPATPTNAFALGEVSVPAGSTTAVANSAITDRRSIAVGIGGILPVLSTALPANPYPGMEVYCTDTDEIRVWSAAVSAWRVQSIYPLPGISVAPPTAPQQQITSTTQWGTLPTRQFIDFTAGKSMFVMLSLNAWVDSGTGTDVRATIALTGATTGPGPSGALVNNTSQTYGDSLFQSSQDVYGQCSISVPWLLNAGTTRVEAVAYRSNATAACFINYAVLRVMPLRYA